MVTHEPADDNMHREYKRQQKRLGAELSQARPNQDLGGKSASGAADLGREGLRPPCPNRTGSRLDCLRQV